MGSNSITIGGLNKMKLADEDFNTFVDKYKQDGMCYAIVNKNNPAVPIKDCFGFPELYMYEDTARGECDGWNEALTETLYEVVKL
jgi:hypothetical protein